MAYFLDNTVAGQFYATHMELVDRELGHSPHNEHYRSRLQNYITNIWIQHSHPGCFWINWPKISLKVKKIIVMLIDSIKARNTAYLKRILDAASNKYGYSLYTECLLESIDTGRMDYVETALETLKNDLNYPEFSFN